MALVYHAFVSTITTSNATCRFWLDRLAACQFAQLLIDQRRQFVRGCFFVTSDRRQNLRRISQRVIAVETQHFGVCSIQASSAKPLASSDGVLTVDCFASKGVSDLLAALECDDARRRGEP